jgi:hypothetical protein
MDTPVLSPSDRDLPATLMVHPGGVVEVEALTRHAGDAPDLVMDGTMRALRNTIPEADRGLPTS